MVKQANHRIVSAINSREITDIQKWLQQFPNLKIVSRDGSNIYRLAIELTNPNIIQVSDRFHLIKGLSDAIKEELKKILPRQIVIDELKIDDSKKSVKERYEKIKNDIRNGEKISVACKNNMLDIRTFKKLFAFNEEKLNNYFNDKYTVKRQETIDRKNKEISLVKDLYNKGQSLAAISEQTGFDCRTVKKYVQSEKLLTIDDTKRERTSSCSPYHDIINELLINHVKIKGIYLEIQKRGYQGKYGAVKNYISNIRKSVKLTYKKTLSRKDLLRLLYNPLNDNKLVNKDTLNVVYQKYPLSKQLLELMYEFKGILLKNKSEKALARWFNKAERFDLEYINTFVNGCHNDMSAIINSIKYSYSNGVVEASVNKIKLIKRIMYGRCGFDLLKAKTLRLEFLRNFN